jgi:hypothetical protein
VFSDEYPRRAPYLLEQVFTLYNAQDEREYFVCIGPWRQATYVGNRYGKPPMKT